MKAAFLAIAVLATAGVVFYFSTTVNAKARGTDASAQTALASTSRASQSRAMSPAKSISLPLFFEPNQGQTAPQVKFVARGAGYGLFLTSDEAVLSLHRPSSAPTATAPRTATAPLPASSSVIRMKLEGANSAASVSGTEPLPGKSNYFIGNDPAKWRQNIPQFARVEYKGVYPGVDLVYYGDQGQLEYDFRVAPGAEPSRIALSFQGASTRIESGDLILATDQGDVRFHAPRIYQQNGNAQSTIAGSFRQLAGNRIAFTIGDYDHSRELVIDPALSYSTYFGGANGVDNGIESSVKVAVDSSGFIYLAGSTNSDDLPFPPSSNSPQPFQSTRHGAQNVFIAVINPNPPSGSSQLVYATYLGGSGTDFPAGIAVSTNVDQLMTGIDIYVGGTTSSADFPITSSTGLPPFQVGPPTDPGNHGFVTRLNVPTFGTPLPSTLRYSTYLSGTNALGTATDTMTGLAIDGNGDAFVTGVTTSTNDQSNGFPANANGFQRQSNSPAGNPQFFASKIDTKSTGGSLSMIYSTYFGGATFNGSLTVKGGGIAVDPPPNNAPNMYITGETNYLPATTGGFPLFNAQQSCLDEPGNHGTCTPLAPPSNPDGFVAKINPNPNGFGANPLYSTYIGGTGSDAGVAIAVDSSGNAYVTGSTNSTDWVATGSGFQTVPGGSVDAFIVKIGNLTGSFFPLTYFSYLGGTGDDFGQAIQVDSVQAVRVVGKTNSPNLPVTSFTLQPCLGEPPPAQPPCSASSATNAFVALIGTTLAGRGAGDYLTYLGGSGTDQGTGVAIDPVFGATYVAGTTTSPNFPTHNPYQATLNGSQNAFVSTIGASSGLTLFSSTTSPSPKPVPAGTQAAFTFEIGNNGPDIASQVIFTATVPSTGLAIPATAKVTSGTGTCSVQGATVTCIIPTLAVCTPSPTCSSAAVEVDVTPAITGTATQILVTGQVTANNSSSVVGPISQTDDVVDFTVTASPSTATIVAGDTATFQVTFCAAPTGSSFFAAITPSQTTSPSIVTATAPTFTPTPVTPGSSCGTTTLRIPTVARPVTTGSVFRRGSFYAAWLPIGGLTLVGLGMGAGRKRRRWLAAVVLGVIGGAILLQSGCGGSSSSSVTPGGGTQAGTYSITITGSAGTGASHNFPVFLTVS
jgi:beta-propeller repeat-containing protein